KEGVLEKEAPETAPDGPLLDLSDAAVKKLTHSAKKRGYVTHDQINSVLPPEEVNSQEIVDVLADETEVIEPDERRQRNGKDESTEGVDVEEIWRKPMSVRSPIPSPQPALCRGGVGWAAPRPAVVD